MKRPFFCNWNITSVNRKAAIAELLELFPFRSNAQDLLLTALETREQAEPTIVHKGIAMPHCRSILVDDFMIAIVKSKKGIPWPEEKVEVIILFITPVKPSGPDEHMKLIRHLARLLRTDGAEKLLSADSPTEAASILHFTLQESKTE